jgi:hypothetical protein
MQNNLFFGGIFSDQTSPKGSNYIIADPLFINPSIIPSKANFHLLPNSPAINTGTNDLIPSSQLIDFDGVNRPQGAGFDIGAYESKYSVQLPTVPSSPPTSVPVDVTFLSSGRQGNSILELAPGSNAGEIKNSGPKSFLLGDDAANRQYVAILSFNTASLPDNAIIQSAVLRILQSGRSTNPDMFSIFGSLSTDIIMGSFGENSDLQMIDAIAATSSNTIGNFDAARKNGWYSASLKAAGLSKINKTGLTQFRLHFTKATNRNNSADVVRFVSGDASEGQPQLIIVYMQP